MDLWSKGERSRSSSEQAAVLLDRLALELRHLVTTDNGVGEPRVKLYCDYVEQDLDSDGIAEFRAQRLLFVGWVFEERTHPLLLEAGTRTGEGLHFTGQNELGQAADRTQEDPEDEARHPPGVERGAQEGAFAEELLLSLHLVGSAGPHPIGERPGLVHRFAISRTRSSISDRPPGTPSRRIANT